MSLTCSICHREGFDKGYQIAVESVTTSLYKTSKFPVGNLLILCPECYGQAGLTPHDIEESSSTELPSQEPVEEDRQESGVVLD